MNTGILKKQGSETGNGWWDTLATATKDELGKAVISTTGVRYHPELVQTKQIPTKVVERGKPEKDGAPETVTYGGFFQSVDKENRESAIRALLDHTQDKGQWLIDWIAKPHEYNKGGLLTHMNWLELNPKSFANLTSEQQAFARAYHKIQTMFLNTNQAGNPNFGASIFVNAASDGTLTDKEWFEILRKGGFEKDLQVMAKSGLAGAFIHLTGGEVQQLIDLERRREVGSIPTYKRYDSAEFGHYLSSAKAAAEDIVRVLFGKNATFDQSVDLMESVCKTIEGRNFNHSNQKTR